MPHPDGRRFYLLERLWSLCCRRRREDEPNRWAEHEAELPESNWDEEEWTFNYNRTFFAEDELRIWERHGWVWKSDEARRAWRSAPDPRDTAVGESTPASMTTRTKRRGRRSRSTPRSNCLWDRVVGQDRRVLVFDISDEDRRLAEQPAEAG